MSLNKEKINFNNIVIPKIKKINRIPESKMVEELTTYSGNDFEMFIFEWLRFCKKEINSNSLLFRIGGTGDKGIDIYYKNNNKVVYYQAKQYNHQLTLHEIIDIVSKIMWYVYKGQIDNPDKIYIVSSKGITPNTIKVLKNGNELLNEVLKQIPQSLKRNNISYEKKELPDFLTFLNKQNLNMVKNIDVNEIVYDYYKSELGPVRFYKQEPFRFRIKIKKEDYNKEKFVSEIEKVFKNSKRKTDIISDAKDNYYSCLCLKETDKYLFGNNEEFELAKEDLYQAVNMLFYNNLSSQDSYINCLNKATQANINNSVLGEVGLNIINNSDKKGLCHYLVNEDKLKWEMDNEEN